MRGRRISGLMLASGLALAAMAGAHAQTAPAPDRWHQDAARTQDALDKQRETLTRQVAAGDIKALTPLASMVEHGDATHDPDPAAALDLYEKAANLGSAVGIGKISVAYILGEGRPRDPARALAFCDKLIDESPTALFARGYAAHEGVGEKVDLAAATALFTRAVDAGNGPAADMLGRDALAAGRLDEARNWFRKGVYRESVDALDDMAQMAESGQGGPQDTAEARWLYIAAAQAGNAHARTWVARHPDVAPPPRLVLEKDKAIAGITETFTDAKGKPFTRPVDIEAVTMDFMGYYPPRAHAAHTGGYAAIECYVDAADKVDACWLRHEDPPGYGFARTIEQLYEGDITVAGTDAAGQPTAQHAFLMGIKWGDPW